MKYPSGNDMAVGVPIWWNEGSCVGRVSLILETADQWTKWGLDEPGLFVCCDCSGKTVTQDIFFSKKYFEDEGIERITLAEETEIKNLYTKLCSQNPEAKDCSFNIRHHIPSKGIKWVFFVFLDASRKKYYANFEGSTEFITVSENDI
jgi:hypothetical protein